MNNKIQSQAEQKYFCHPLLSILLVAGMLATFSLQEAFAQAEVVNVKGEFVTEGAQSVHPDDSLALANYFYHSMKVDTWMDNSGWLEDMVVFWKGVDRIEEIEVEPDVYEWRITRIVLVDPNMTECGYLPPEISQLKYLEWIHIRRNLVCGDIPREIFTELEFIERLSVQRAALTGEIPFDAIAQTSYFNFMRIEDNDMTGPVMTADVADWPKSFQRLWMSNNWRLTGSIPPEFYEIENLQFIEMAGLPNIHGPMPDFSRFDNIRRVEIQKSNWDSAPFPTWPRDIPNLQWLNIWETNMTGGIPEWIIELGNVEILKIGGSQMEQNMADFPNLSLMPSLEEFRLFGGNFHGDLPAWICDTNLERFWISNTNIGGDLPGCLRNLTALTHLKLDNNKFTGGLPDELQELTALENLIVRYNEMEIGEIPQWIGQNLVGINQLDLSGSGVSGTIPANLANIESLTYFKMANNPDLGGEFPSWIWGRDLWGLDISHTNIQLDEIPQELQNLKNLKQLGLGGLGLTGSIPSWLGQKEQNFKFLRLQETREWYPYVSLEDNNLSGPIPATMGELSSIDSLNLSNNQLEGNIDMLASVGRLDMNTYLLGALDVSGNPGLTGEIPSEFTNHYSMRVFHFDGTDLCMPAGFDSWLDQVLEDGGMSAWGNRKLPYASVTDPSTAVFCDDLPTSAVVDVPNRFYLHQSYPNPFNPSTTVKFEIAEDANVRLAVYDVIGQRISTLVNETMSAGVHQVHFDAGNLASGQYIYRLEAGDRVMTRSMTLVK